MNKIRTSEYEQDVHISMNKYNGKMGFYSECNQGRLVHILSIMHMKDYAYDECECGSTLHTLLAQLDRLKEYESS